MQSQKLTVSDIVAAAAANPDGFVSADFANQRSSKKSANKYMDVLITRPNGKKSKLGFSWKLQPLCGSIKKPSERKFGPTIQFRRCSGDLGEASVLVYDSLEAQLGNAIANGTAKPKKGKENFCTIVQKELENGDALEPDMAIIRFKLPFDDNGKPLFKLMKIENRGGKPRPRHVPCTEDNVHLIIKPRMLTSGYVTADTLVMSAFGVSVPARVSLLIIKEAEPEAPDPEDFMTEEDLLAMAGDDTGDNDTVDDTDVKDTVDDAVDDAVDNDDTPSIEDSLAALQMEANANSSK